MCNEEPTYVTCDWCDGTGYEFGEILADADSIACLFCDGTGKRKKRKPLNGLSFCGGLDKPIMAELDLFLVDIFTRNNQK